MQPQEDKEAFCTSVSMEVKAMGLPNPKNCWDYFIQEVHKLLDQGCGSQGIDSLRLKPSTLALCKYLIVYSFVGEAQSTHHFLL